MTSMMIFRGVEVGEEATATVSIAKAQSTEQRRKGAGSPSLSLRVTDFQLIFRFGLDFLQPPWLLIWQHSSTLSFEQTNLIPYACCNSELWLDLNIASIAQVRLLCPGLEIGIGAAKLVISVHPGAGQCKTWVRHGELRVKGFKMSPVSLVTTREKRSRERKRGRRLQTLKLFSSPANAASGFAVDDDCKLKFLELKAKRTYRFIVFKIEEEQKQVIVEKLGEPAESYENFTASLPADECRYAVYDFDFVTEENCQKSRIFFIAWSPDTSRVRSKMIYASSKDRFKRELDGIQVELQATDPTEIGLDVIKSRAS
ncbi:unnamed protein product [Prunus armeniaca]|uniref:ADF-H domain-containing protein n=1 Tax=Prunus armeniaca TaxID=36596 RepID=A0A6J5XLR7_PRUAR|nr:unnamed protein product [Prunus armeniaca]CAB4312925.1 unnamed protein product [Prunus armeniaca]